jgi:hypothetical protein
MASDDARYKLLYEQALRGIERQAARLAELRSRATNLFGAGAIAAGFLAAEVFKPGTDLTALAWVGAGAFALTGCLLGITLLPWTWKLSVANHTDVSTMIDNAESLSTMHNSLAHLFACNYRHNEPKLRHLAQAVSAMALGVVVEVLALLGNLAIQ